MLPEDAEPQQQEETRLAAWIPADEEKPKPSSYMPVPERAARADGSAAPPASSDRRLTDEEVAPLLRIRTVPVRISVETDRGRIHSRVHPSRVTVRPSDGIEWDFRYMHGTDVIVKSVEIILGKKRPISKSKFSSKVPRGSRPHRHFSGEVRKNAAGSTFSYEIRLYDAARRVVSVEKAEISVLE